MKNEISVVISPVAATQENVAPFVNEECGDTMWDKVLEEAEQRALAAATDSTAVI
jgi:hypothetical protein